MAHIVLKAIGDKLSELNILKSVSGCLTDRMAEDLERLEDAYKEIAESVGKTERVYIINANDIPEDKWFSDLTDDEIIKLSKNNYSVEEFIEQFNADCLYGYSEFAKVIVR